MIKRILSVIACFILLCSVTVCAETAADIKIQPPEDFYILGKDNVAVAEALKVSEAELQNIDDVFFAVDKANKRQIRLAVKADDVAIETKNISHLSNRSLMSLAPQITGVENAKGEVVEKDGQKFIKIQLRSADEGGDYVLTRYFTVAGEKSYVLSFWTDINTDREYITEVFETLDSSDFISKTAEKNSNIIFYLVVAGTVIFLAACVIVGVTVVRDLKKEKEK